MLIFYYSIGGLFWVITFDYKGGRVLTCLVDLNDYLPILSKNFDLFSKYQVIVLTGIPVAPFGW